MAPSNGTTSTPQTWSPPSPTVAHYNGTRRWHPAMAPTAPCNGTLVPRPIRQSGSSPSPPIGSKNPYSYRYLGKKNNTYWNHPFRSIKHLGMGVAIWWVIVFSPKMVCWLSTLQPISTRWHSRSWTALRSITCDVNKRNRPAGWLGTAVHEVCISISIYIYIQIDIFVYTVYPFVNCKYAYIYIFTYTYVYINDIYIYICITHTWKMEVEPTKHARRNGEPPQVFFFRKLFWIIFSWNNHRVFGLGWILEVCRYIDFAIQFDAVFWIYWKDVSRPT